MISNLWQHFFQEEMIEMISEQDNGSNVTIPKLSSKEHKEMGIVMKTCTHVDSRGLKIINHQLINNQYPSVLACVGDIRRLFRNS